MGGYRGFSEPNSDIMSAPTPGPNPPPGTMLRVRQLRVRTYESLAPAFPLCFVPLATASGEDLKHKTYRLPRVLFD